MDNSEGNCQVLIGLKNQSIQTKRICTFKSDKFPEVGVNLSPVLKRFVFVGEDPIGAHGSVVTTTLETEPSLPECSAFSSQTTFDNQLHEFLSAEKSAPLQDIHCEICSKAANCVNCKAARSDKTFTEIGEDAIIKQALEVHRVSGKNDV